MSSVAASWDGAVEVLMTERDGVTWVTITALPWQGRGFHAPLYSGPLAGLAGRKL
jgi:hypothetical protein